LGARFETRGLRRVGGDSGDQAVNCLSENSFEPEEGETRTMKKLTLITAVLALLGGASIVSAANQTPNRQKLSPRKLRRPKQNAADKPDAAEVAARRPTATSREKTRSLRCSDPALRLHFRVVRAFRGLRKTYDYFDFFKRRSRSNCRPLALAHLLSKSHDTKGYPFRPASFPAP
jgi:hypothetical protein